MNPQNSVATVSVTAESIHRWLPIGLCLAGARSAIANSKIKSGAHIIISAGCSSLWLFSKGDLTISSELSQARQAEARCLLDGGPKHLFGGRLNFS